MARKTIREVARETSQELGVAFSRFKGFVKKRARVPPRVAGQPPLAFAVVQQPRPVMRSQPIKRRKRRRR